MKKWKLLTGVVLIFFIGLTGWCVPKICIDPGHGGSDSGAVGYVTEKAINLDASLKFRDWLNADTNDAGGGYSASIRSYGYCGTHPAQRGWHDPRWHG